MGGNAILLALFFSNFVGSMFMVFYEKMWQKIKIHAVRWFDIKEMLSYSIPLVPTAVSWWVANMSDRILILAFLGNGMNGIYAAANKIPAIYTTIYTIFNLAWTENVTLSMKDKGRDAYLDKMMRASYKLFSFLILVIICCSSLFFKLLIGIRYQDAYPHIFILLIAVFINSVCATYGSVFIGFKDSKATGITTIIGAVVNVIINLCCIRVIGLYAASISTVLSYLVILLIRMMTMEKYVKIRLPLTYTLELCAVFTIVGFAYFINNLLLMFAVMVGVCVWGMLSNKDLIRSLGRDVMRKIHK